MLAIVVIVGALGLAYVVGRLLTLRAGLLKAEKVLDEAALDRYSFTRDAWLQRRRNHVFDGRPPRDPDDE